LGVVLVGGLALVGVACAPAPGQTSPASGPQDRVDTPTEEVRFPGRVAGFQLTRAAEAHEAPDPPASVRVQWAGVLRQYQLARLDGNLVYLGTAEREDGAQLWAFRVQTRQRVGGGRATGDYELVFATSSDGDILDAR
jgi:hypothetical protein